MTARLNPRSDRSLEVAFKASRGTVSGVQASFDSAGRAVAVLQSDTRPGVVVVTAEVKRGDTIEASRSIDVTFGTVAAGSVVRLFVIKSVVAADGASLTEVRAEVNPGLANRSVTIETTNGSFSATDPNLRSVSLTASDAGIARTILYAPQTVGSALVTATAGGFSAAETVTFGVAPPDALALKVSPLSLPASDTDLATIVATLSRLVGKVTLNTTVEFSAFNEHSGAAFGSFTDVRRSNADEQATAAFVAGSSAPLGPAIIRARVPGTTLSEEVRIVISAPVVVLAAPVSGRAPAARSWVSEVGARGWLPREGLERSPCVSRSSAVGQSRTNGNGRSRIRRGSTPPRNCSGVA